MAAVAEYDTDIVYDDLTFTRAGVKEVSWYGFPSCFSGLFRCWQQTRSFIKIARSVEKRRAVILDARKRELNYETCGFTLRPFKSTVTDWEQVTVSDSEQQKLFKAQLEAEVRKLHPDVKLVQFAGMLLRGGEGSNPPATDALHLDVFPDFERVKQVQEASDTKSEPIPDGLELKIMLGLWMPREMNNPVYDYPFMFGDVSTFSMEEDAVAMTQEFNHIAEGGQIQKVINLASAAPHFADRQRWYYYNKQTCEELVVFRHLTEPKGGKACFHAAIKQPLPEGMETRKSVETRALLFF
eukprot:TRINITY_DN39540_c0_g1_i1.p1 TRINITY_DN39540_c0_g1~~TRINITY_DN39540_c0_g1_i1.p1  ORF type:complete len:318 (-),score=62.58 TRINITY_DN39540_c0_g1_i1:86-976(-)